LDDYNTDNVEISFATLAQVARESVTVNMVSASVKIQVTIKAADAKAAAALKATLRPYLATVSAVWDSFGIPVLEKPSVQDTVLTTLVSEGREKSSSDGNTIIIIAVAAGGGVLLLITLITCVRSCARQVKPSNVYGTATPISVQMDMQSTMADGPITLQPISASSISGTRFQGVCGDAGDAHL